MAGSQVHIASWVGLLVLATCTPPSLLAQPTVTTPPALRFEHLDSRDGLSHNTAFSIHQDRHGYLWIGTADGLNRYDGYTFTVYRHNSNDTTSLSNNTVRWVAEDGHGNLWVATRSGLDRFDWETGRFSRSGLRWDTLTQAITGPVRDQKAAFWIYVNDRLFRFDNQTDAFHPTFTLPTTATLATSREAPGAPDQIWSLFRDRSGTLWLGTVQGLLYSYKPETERWEQFASPRKSIRVRFEEEQGRLWIAYESTDLDQQGTGVFDPEAGTFTPFSIDDEAGVVLRLHDRQGSLWFTSREGLYQYTPATKAHRFVPFDPAPLRGAVWDAMEDEAGALWVATLSGLYRLGPHTKPFRHLSHDPTDPNSLSDNAIMAVAEGRGAVVWVGTLGGGLNRIDQRTGAVRRYRHQADTPGSLCHDALWSLYEDRQGTLWIGTDQGLCRFDPRTQQFARVPLPTSTAWPLSHPPPVNAIREDATGRLWVATNDGLYRIDPRTDTVKHYRHFADETDPASGFLQTLHVDHDGFLWLGSFRNALYRFDPVTEEIATFPRLAQTVPASDEGFWAIHEDPRGFLWLGSDRGLTRFDPRTGTAHHYAQQDGLPASIVYAILEDDAQRLWVSTNEGLARLTDRYPDAPAFRAYDLGDGLQNAEFNRRAALKQQQGTFLFGGMHGLTTFDPEQIRDHPYRPPVVLTQIQTSNRDTTVTIPPFGRQDLALSYRDYTVSFAFAALNFTHPDQNHYAYQLEGFDEGWIEAGLRRQVQYTNIPPGAYTFRVKATNNDGVWNDDGVALRVTVTPPFWQTWWFRALVLAAIVAALTAAYRYRVARLLEMERMRLRIASDLHDDIGSKLSSIALMSELVGKHTALQDRDAQRLTKIGEVARDMVGALRDIVWLVNPDHDRIEDLVGRMHDVATTMLAGRLHHFDCSKDRLPHALSMALRRNVYLIYREALHNIVKHAQATEVDVRLEADRHKLVLIVTDNGVGFDPEAAHRGYGLQTMRTRADQLGGTLVLTSRAGQGTTLTLSVKA